MFTVSSISNLAKKLCLPSKVFLALSLFSFTVMVIQNVSSNSNRYCVGSYSCNANKYVIFVLKFVYILLWTYILNMLCSWGLASLSWFFVLFSFIGMFLSITLIMLNFNTHL